MRELGCDEISENIPKQNNLYLSKNILKTIIQRKPTIKFK